MDSARCHLRMYEGSCRADIQRSDGDRLAGHAFDDSSVKQVFGPLAGKIAMR